MSSPGAPMVKNLLAVRENRVQSLDQEDPLEKGMATHSSILDWRIPWMGSLVGYSPWGHKELNMSEYTLGVGDAQGSLVCCIPWGHEE